MCSTMLSIRSAMRPLVRSAISHKPVLSSMCPDGFAPSYVPCAVGVGLLMRFLVHYTACYQRFSSCISCDVPGLFVVFLGGRAVMLCRFVPSMFLLHWVLLCPSSSVTSCLLIVLSDAFA